MNSNVREVENRNKVLDFLKGIGCIGIVFMHIAFPGKVGEVIHLLAQFAVPIFFMISGFYLYIPNENSCKKIKFKIRRIIKITIYSLFLYLILKVFLDKVYEKTTFELIKVISDKENIIKILLFGNFDFIYASHLWFFIGYIYGYLIIFLFEKYNLYNKIYKFLPLIFVIKFIIDFIIRYMEMSWYFHCFFLINALPYMLLGHYISANKEKLLRLKNKILIFIVSLSVIIMTLLTLFGVNQCYMGIFLVITSISLFIFAINNPQKSLNMKIQELGHKYSLYVYILHVAVKLLMEYVLILFGFNLNNKINNWIYPVIVLFATIILSICISKIIDDIKSK